MSIFRAGRGKLEDWIKENEEILLKGLSKTPSGVSEDRVSKALSRLSLKSPEKCKMAVMALLDDQTSSFFTAISRDEKVCAGANVGHVACHIGFLQMGASKADRENIRDDVLRPMRILGVLDAVTLKDGEFVPGHVTANNSNNSYRLTDSFKGVLQASDDTFQVSMDRWLAASESRERSRLDASVSREMKRGDQYSGHQGLIRAAADIYAPRFLPDYLEIFRDAEFGKRVSDEDTKKLATHGFQILPGDPMPDLLYYKPETEELWVYEAVVSDGEVDEYKVEMVELFAERHGKTVAGYTTGYLTLKDFQKRQSRSWNLAPNSKVWILEQPSKQMEVQV